MDLAAELYSYYQLAAKVTNVGGLEGPRERLGGPGDNVLGSMKDPSISFPLTARQSLRATEPELSVNEMEDIVPGSPHGILWSAGSVNKKSIMAGCSIRSMRVRPRIQEPICYLLGELGIEDPPKSRVNPTANHRLTLDLWLAKDNRFLNPKISYERILMAPPCRLIPRFQEEKEPTIG